MTPRIPSTGKPRPPVIVYRPSHVHTPIHEQLFPKKENREGPRNGNETTANPNEPTSTPDFLMKPPEHEEALDRSERIAAGESVAPTEDETKWIEIERDDWLDKDADTSAHA